MSATISRDTLRQKLASTNPPVLLEALPVKYYAAAHLPGAVNFPHDRARELAPVVAPDKAREIVVYCASNTCQNSHVAARVLESIGYTNVAVYADGKQDWIDAGLAVDVGTSQHAA